MNPAISSATKQRVAISYSSPSVQPGDPIGIDDEWEVASTTENCAQKGSPLDYEIEFEPEEASHISVASESSPVAQQARVSAQPPPLPPRKCLSSGLTRRTPPPPPRRTIEVVTIELEPAQDQLTSVAATQPQPQPTTLQSASQLPQPRASRALVTWLLAGIALFGLSSSVTALYQLRALKTSESRLASSSSHETRPAARQVVAQPPTCLQSASVTRSEPVANPSQVVSKKTAADAATTSAALTKPRVPSKTIPTRTLLTPDRRVHVERRSTPVEFFGRGGFAPFTPRRQ